MKIYRGLSSVAGFYPHDDHIVRLVGRDCLSDLLLDPDGQISFESYDLKVHGEDIQVNDVWYRYQKEINCKHSVEAFEKGDCAYLDSDGNFLPLQPDVQAYLSGQNGQVPDEFYALKGLWTNLQIVRCSISENRCTESPVENGVALTHAPPYLICMNRGDRHMFCLDYNFQQQWQRSDEMDYVTNPRTSFEVNRPTIYADGFLLNHGATSVIEGHFIGRNGAEKTIDVYQLCDLRRYRSSDGEVIWRQEISGEIQQYQLVDDFIFVCTNNCLFKLSAETGEILHQTDTGCAAVFDRGNFGNTMYAVNQYVFFGHASDHKFHIYSAEDLTLVRDVELPDKWHIFPKSQPYYHAPTNKLYLQATLFDKVWMKQALLEISLENIDAEIEIEQGPEFSIEIVASESDDREKEISISTGSNDFERVLRFAELYARDLAFRHGASSMGADSVTEGFNGIVQFHYLADANDAPGTSKKLEMMEQRFASWATSYAMKSADGSVDCSLRTSLS